jgi:hypothetical protein
VYTLRIQNQAKQTAYSRPPLALAFLRSQTFIYTRPKQENNQEITDKPHVPQADPSTIGLQNRTKGETGKKGLAT